MIVELDLEGSVILKLGGAGSGYLVHFIEAGPGEADLGGSIVDVEAGLHGPEGDLAVPTRLHDQGRRSAEIQVIPVPQVGLDDAPSAHDRVLRGLHVAAPARSFGRRTRL